MQPSGQSHGPVLTLINAKVITPLSVNGVPRGGDMGKLRVESGCSVVLRGGKIESILSEGQPFPEGAVFDCRGRVVMPGLVDCHTHLCWAGDRLGEWEMKLAGKPYLEILKAGGGIMSTVRAVRGASQAELTRGILLRLETALTLGTTTIEIKSGYGLSTQDELKMLRAARDAADQWEGTVVLTALLGHAIDDAGPGGAAGFIERTINETLPAVLAEFPGIAVDAFCEEGAWNLEQTTKLLKAARDAGSPVRVHADQFTSKGMVEAAIEMGAASVDHLEASTPETLAKLGAARTIGVGLPGCGLHLGGGKGSSAFANLKAVIEAGGSVAVATNCNPGSSPLLSMPLAMAMGVRACGLTPDQAISAGTAVPARVLGLADRGVIERGMRADLIVLNATDHRELVFTLGSSVIAAVIAGGVVLHQA